MHTEQGRPCVDSAQGKEGEGGQCRQTDTEDTQQASQKKREKVEEEKRRQITEWSTTIPAAMSLSEAHMESVAPLHSMTDLTECSKCWIPTPLSSLLCPSDTTRIQKANLSPSTC